MHRSISFPLLWSPRLILKILVLQILVLFHFSVSSQALASVPNALSLVTDDLRQRLENHSAGQAFSAGDVTVQSLEKIKEFYAQRNYQPAWLDADGPVANADSLLAAVRSADREGLQPADYHKNAISDGLTIVRITHSPSVRLLTDVELVLSDAFFTYGSHLLSGRLNPKTIDHQWIQKPRSKDLVKLLQDTLSHGSVSQALNSLAPSHRGYGRLRTALYYYRLLEQNGGWPWVSAGPKLQKGDYSPRVKELRRRLQVTYDLPKTVMAGNTGAASNGQPAKDLELYFDAALHQAVQRFQLRHGLHNDGIVGPNTLAELNVTAAERVRQLELNLERWRWLPEELGQKHIMVNITNFEMAVVEDDRPVLDARVVVGMSKRPTPVFTGRMSYLVLNPYWHVPRTIAIADKLPQLRRNPYALRRQGIRIFDTSRGGGEIDPGSVDWTQVSAKNFHFQLRQDPGPGNALGRIKFMFPNRHNVYLHDTPTPQLFERTQRTYSSGCIRISKPIELAEYLLKNTDWNRDAIVSASNGRRERSVKLPEEIPVHLLYWTAWADEDGTVHFRKDIYERDKPLAQALFPI